MRSARPVSSVHTIEERLPRQRQDGERPGGQKMLLGAAVDASRSCATVVTMPTGRRTSRRLMPARSRNRERAPSAATSRRARIVAAVGQPHVDVLRDAGPGSAVGAHRGRPQPTPPAPSPSRAARRGAVHVLDHVRERLAGRDLAAKGEEGRPHGVVELANSEITMSRIGCALGATASHTLSVSNRRRAAAAMAEARASVPGRPSEGSASVTVNAPRRAPLSARSPAPARRSRRRRSARRPVRSVATASPFSPFRHGAMSHGFSPAISRRSIDRGCRPDHAGRRFASRVEHLGPGA